MELIPLLIQLVSGAAGGNIAGALLKNISLGTLGNSIAGIIGGGLGAKLLGILGILAAAKSGGTMDIGSILGNVLGGGAGGGALMAIVGVIRSMMAK
jgi:hypothetical protein